MTASRTPPDGRLAPAYLAYRVGSALARRAPERVVLAAASGAAWAVSRVNQRRRTVVRRNLARVVGEQDLERTVDEAFRSYGRYWAETLRTPKPGIEEIRRRTTVEGLEPVADHVASGKGLIFVGPHVGSWDIAGAWLAAQGWRVVTVAEEVKPPALYELFVRLRKRVGLEVYPVGHAATVRVLLSALGSGGVVGLIADRDISGTGVEVELFGETTRLPAGPAMLALRTGSPLAVGALYQRPGGHFHGVIAEMICVQRSRGREEEVRELTQRIAHRMEDLIRKQPGQWHLFQPNWPSDPGYRHPG